MKIPKNFLIKGNEWRVEYKWNLLDDNGEKCLGLCDTSERVLLIDRLASKDDKEDTFIHEYIHAICFEYFLYQDGGLSGFAEEVVCSAISSEIRKLFILKLRGNK